MESRFDREYRAAGLVPQVDTQVIVTLQKADTRLAVLPPAALQRLWAEFNRPMTYEAVRQFLLWMEA
jgi:hypothetical protein